MIKGKWILSLVALFAVSVTAVFASSTFQNSCSNIEFIYEGNAPAISASCLKTNGSVKHTTLVIEGITNRNGQLKPAPGASTFQQSCGNINVEVVDASTVNLTALCRRTDGKSVESEISLDNISNENGNLTKK